MCGIVGYIGRREAVPVLIEGLRRLEYRGYDSAGLAVIYRGKLQVIKTAGRVQDLRDQVNDRMRANIGIGHTRWATHGEPNETNAHPHLDAAGHIAVVHNGIIENADALRAQLEADRVKFASDSRRSSRPGSPASRWRSAPERRIPTSAMRTPFGAR